MIVQDYTNEKFKVDTLFSIVLFILCPALAIVSTLIYIYKGRYNHLTILAMSIAMVTLFTPPFADIYRHTLLYFNYGNYAWAGIFQSNEHDFIFYSLTHLFAQYNIPFEFISYLFVFTCYQIAFFLFRQVIKSETAKEWGTNTRFVVFLCFLLMVPFIAIVNGLRMATAAYIAVFGWYFILNNKRILGILAYLLACGMHFGAMLFIPLMIFTILPKININRVAFVIGVVILLLLGNILLSLLPPEFIATMELEEQVTSYMTDSVERFDETMSANGLIAMFLERAPLIVIGVLALFNKLHIDYRSKSIIYFVIWLAFLYYPFTVLFQRYAFLAVPILVYLSFRNINQPTGIKFYTHKIIALSCVIMTLSYAYGYRETVKATKYYKMFYPSIYTIPTTDTRENFRDALVPKE